jgi:VCBS repeat-containing protein
MAVNGTLTLNLDGSFTYMPDPDFNGSDSFTYFANDGLANSNTATVTITIDPVNDPPVANDDTATTPENTVLIVPAPGVLVNDTDLENDPLTAILVTGPANGALSFFPDGGYVYTPTLNFNGLDSFTYQANDGQLSSNVATVTISVGPVNDPPVAYGDTANTNEILHWLSLPLECWSMILILIMTLSPLYSIATRPMAH